MSDARYQAMLAKDARLEAEIAQLKAQNLALDPNYAPTGMDQDVMYNKEFVNSSLGVDQGYDPYAGIPPVSAQQHRGSGSSGVGAFFGWMFGIILVIGVCCFVGYFVLVKEY